MIKLNKNGIVKIAVTSMVVAGVMIGIFFFLRTPTVAQVEQPLPQDSKRIDTRSKRVVDVDQPDWHEIRSIRALINESRVIAIGTVVRNVCKRSDEGSQVTTDYEVRLQEVIRGNAAPDSVISLSMPGGLVTEPDNTLFSVRTKFVRKMQNGKTYLLFLKDAPAGANTLFMPIRGSQGLYEIPQNGSRVIHLGRPWDNPNADDGEEITSFLQDVRDLAHSRR